MPDTTAHGPAPTPVPISTTLSMMTRTPGTFVYLNADSTPIYLLDNKFTTRVLAPGIVQIRIRSNQSGCRDRVLVDTLRIGRDKRKQLDPDCPT